MSTGSASSDATVNMVAEMAGFRSALYGTLVQRVQRWGTFGHLKQTALRSICERILGCLSVAGDSDTQFGDGLVYGSSESQQEFAVETCGLTWKAMLDLVEVEGAIRMIHADVGIQDCGALMMSPGDLDRSLRASGYTLLRDEAEQLHRLLDVDRTGRVNSLDVIAALVDWRTVQRSPRWEEWCDEMFKVVDANNSGSIEPQDVAVFLPDESAQGASSSRVQSVFAKHDHNRDGVIDIGEWRHLLLTVDALDVYDSRFNVAARGQRVGPEQKLTNKADAQGQGEDDSLRSL